MIDAKIVADSVSPAGKRITTFVLTYPRFIHSELMTHRMLSRNASSSRAIPVRKQVRMVLANPAMPIAFRQNKKGMQAGNAFGPFKQFLCRLVWRLACYSAVFFATLMDRLNVHKQYANRLIEPFSHITVVATATEWANFFALRRHPDAQPELSALASAMYDVMVSSTPVEKRFGEWHLPFIDEGEDGPYSVVQSVARCARTSYLNHEGVKSTVEQDQKMYLKLVGSVPLHASPAEHQAQASDDPAVQSGNLRGWIQLRKQLANENVSEYEGIK